MNGAPGGGTEVPPFQSNDFSAACKATYHSGWIQGLKAPAPSETRDSGGEQTRAILWEKGWRVEVMRAVSGSFALERRAQDDGKNRQSQRKKQIPFGNDKQKNQSPAPSGRQEPHPNRDKTAVRMGHPASMVVAAGGCRLTYALWHLQEPHAPA